MSRGAARNLRGSQPCLHCPRSHDAASRGEGQITASGSSGSSSRKEVPELRSRRSRPRSRRLASLHTDRERISTSTPRRRACLRPRRRATGTRSEPEPQPGSRRSLVGSASGRHPAMTSPAPDGVKGSPRGRRSAPERSRSYARPTMSAPSRQTAGSGPTARSSMTCSKAARTREGLVRGRQATRQVGDFDDRVLDVHPVKGQRRGGEHQFRRGESVRSSRRCCRDRKTPASCATSRRRHVEHASEDRSGAEAVEAARSRPSASTCRSLPAGASGCSSSGSSAFRPPARERGARWGAGLWSLTGTSGYRIGRPGARRSRTNRPASRQWDRRGHPVSCSLKSGVYPARSAAALAASSCRRLPSMRLAVLSAHHRPQRRRSKDERLALGGRWPSVAASSQTARDCRSMLLWGACRRR